MSERTFRSQPQPDGFLSPAEDLIERYSRVGPLRVQRVMLTADRASLYCEHPERTSEKQVKNRRALFEQFLALAGAADPEQFLRFASMGNAWIMRPWASGNAQFGA
jgi:hypothetical protein